MTWTNTVADIIKVKYPIIQAPMLGVSTPEMAAAISNEGGLGSLAVGGLSPAITQQLIHKTKSLTKQPFAVNLFAHAIPAYTEEELEPMRKLLMELAKKRGYQLDAADLAGFTLYNHADQIEILLEEAIPVVSFTFGCLEAQHISRLKQGDCTLVGTATCLAEAIYLEAHHIDMIVAQGIEAGGHRGTFMENIPLPQVGLFYLLPQIAGNVSVPCIAAGGINSAQTMNAAFGLGAAAVQIGSAFINVAESLAIASYKEKVQHATDTDTALTKAFSGRWARGFKNEMMKEIEASGIPIPPYPLQNSLTTPLRKLAQQAGDSDYTTLWAGQSAGAAEGKQTKDVFRDLITQYETLYS